jgi:uncharacterized protein (DUF1015 family)
MALVRPFAGFRYAWPQHDISVLTAPPYDVVSDSQRIDFLAGDPHNVVALELPDGPLDPDAPDNRYTTGARTWDAWKADGVITQDPVPVVYVLEQRFEHDHVPVRRRAFIVEVGLVPFDAGVVLPHERTLPKALGDRFQLIRATGANFSQVLGLYEDPACDTDALFDRATTAQPVATAVDADGVESILWAADDESLASELTAFLADKRIFIADGHHRYTTALAYRDRRRESDPTAPPFTKPSDFVMMALVNIEDPELVVMPTHRVATAEKDFDADAFYSRLSEFFELEDVTREKPWKDLEDVAEPTFLVKTRTDEYPRRARLRADVDLGAAIPLDRSDAWKHLDVAVLQELVLSPLLGIHPDRPETLDRLGFVKDARAALLSTEDHDVVFVLRPTSMEQLRAVALAGETMPQKSTYFYPKLLSGLVFRSAY